MIATDQLIYEWAKAGGITPFTPSLINPTSIDLRLGTQIVARYANGSRGSVDISDCTEQTPFYFYPGDFFLLATEEVFDFGINVDDQWFSGVVKLKSGRSREGLELANAGWVDCGFHGNLTLAASMAPSTEPQQLWPGKRFAQLILLPHVQPLSQYQGNYQHSMGAIASVGYRG